MLWTMILIAGSTPQTTARDAWTTCLNTKGHVFAHSTETTEVAAVATLGSCKEEETEYFRQAYRTPTLERMIAGPRQVDPQFRQAQEARQKREVEDARQTIVAGIAAVRAGIEE